MGNHYGTVRCSQCYERGHNKRSCPKLTKRLQERFKTATGRQATYIAEQIATRTGTNPETGEKLLKRGPTRRCSYCKSQHGGYSDKGLGHTRRTCQDLKDDTKAAIAANVIYRAKLLEGMRASGVGVGSLMNMRLSGYFRNRDTGENEWDRRDCVVMIRSIEWDQVAYLGARDNVMLVQRMDKMGTNDGIQAVGLPYVWETEDGNDQELRFDAVNGWGITGTRCGVWDARPGSETTNDFGRIALLGPVPSESINAPAGWDSGESQTIVDHFRNQKD